MATNWEDQYDGADKRLDIRLIGVGGGGGQAVARMDSDSNQALRVVAVNTDAAALNALDFEGEKLLVGRGITRSLGCGGDPELGQAVAEADSERLVDLVRGADLVFVVTALGGGCGSGVAPILARLATDEGAMVIGFACLPFAFEGTRRGKVAEDAVLRFRESCDALVTLPNDLLLQESQEDTAVIEAFSQADEWMARGIRALCVVLLKVGLVQLDLATLKRAVGGKGGKALFALGSGDGSDYMERALSALGTCPLLNIEGSPGTMDAMVVQLVVGEDFSLDQLASIVNRLNERFGCREETVVGVVVEKGTRSRMDICLLGVTDLENRRFFRERTRGTATKRVKKLHELQTVEPSANDEDEPVKTAPIDKMIPGQGEFDDLLTGGQRGIFDKTSKNIVEGIDLDIPTFIRKGIRIRTSQ